LAKYIFGKRRELQFVVPAIKIQRNDILEIQRRILTMTPAERKSLGINKSTLWHQKKYLSEAKRIKIYKKVFSKLEQDN
jgi:CRISPR-associated protein Cas1